MPDLTLYEAEYEPEYTPMTLDEVEDELPQLVDAAVTHISDTFSDVWEKAQDYYNGESGVRKVKGRSQVVATAVRDAVRNARPSLLRIFLSADTIVEYRSNGQVSQQQAYIQSKFANNQFFQNNGYFALYDAMQNAMLKKYGIIMHWWDDAPKTKYMKLTNVPESDLQAIYQREDVSVVRVDPQEGAGVPTPQGMMPLFTCELAVIVDQGSLVVENVPLSEFFIDEDATSIASATVHGHRRSVPGHEALELGVPFEVLDELDDVDPEEDAAFVGEAQKRRGYYKRRKERQDPLSKKVLITQCYVQYDLDGTGVPQLYRFILGGTKYRYLAHERVESSPYSRIVIDPEPGSFAGKSLFDVMQQDQDTMTSLLRATCDNAHMSNNKRLAVHETLVNMDDVLNTTLGAPIRVRQPGMVQEVGVSSSVGAMLPLLQHLQTQAEVKVGVSNAAVGLDHDALQSTTKEAAMNTISLSQGQIEVMARNIAEGLTDVFRGILRLSLRHMPRQQFMELYGEYQWVDLHAFDPELHMRPAVGLGTGQKEEKTAGLLMVLKEQKEIVSSLGMFNPLVTPQHVFNTYEDLCKLHGIYNVSRYFGAPTEEALQNVQQILEKQAENQPMDPAVAMMEAEKLKAELRAQEKAMEFALKERGSAIDRTIDILKFTATDDLERDRMVQQLYGAAAHKGHTAATQDGVDIQRVKAAQNRSREAPFPTPEVSAL